MTTSSHFSLAYVPQVGLDWTRVAIAAALAVARDAATVSAAEIGRSLRSLHDAMAHYAGALPPRSAVLDEIDWLLEALAEHSSDTALVEERDRLAPLLHHLDEAGQPLHGDASLSNLLSTSTGPRWNDFEDGCFGSPAWDVIGLLDDAREHYSDAFAADMLAAYGREIEAGLTPLRDDGEHALLLAVWVVVLSPRASESSATEQAKL